MSIFMGLLGDPVAGGDGVVSGGLVAGGDFKFFVRS